MPNRRSRTTTTANASVQPSGDFRGRYDAVEAQRDKLIARLAALGDKAQSHPGHKRARTLLNDTFRKVKLAKRAAVLEAAAFMIEVLERLTIGL